MKFEDYSDNYRKSDYTVEIMEFDEDNNCPIIQVTNRRTGKSILIFGDVDWCHQNSQDKHGNQIVFGLNLVTDGHYY